MFESSRLKIERANRHIKELQILIAAFVDPNKHAVVVEANPSGFNEVKLKSSTEVPREIVLVIGDAVHNLRAALDHAMGFAVSTLHSASKKGDISFPFGNTREDIKASLAKGEVQVAMETPIGKKIAAVILDEIKPYGALDEPIRALNKLDNFDKHRLVIAILVAKGMKFSGKVGGMHFTGGNVFMSYGNPGGGPGAMIAMDPNMKFEGDAKPVLDVLINEPNVVDQKSAIPTLTNFSKIVSQAIDAIEHCFVSNS